MFLNSVTTAAKLCILIKNRKIKIIINNLYSIIFKTQSSETFQQPMIPIDKEKCIE